MKSNIINKYGRIQYLSPTRGYLGTSPYIILEIGIIKISHYKLTKKWCRWYLDVENKRYYFNGKLLNITRPNYAACGEYVLEIKCKPNNYSHFANKLIKHDCIESLGYILPGVLN